MGCRARGHGRADVPDVRRRWHQNHRHQRWFRADQSGQGTYAEITDNKQVVRLELKNDYTKKNADTGKVTNYGKNVQFYYTFAQGAKWPRPAGRNRVISEKGPWTSNIEQTSMLSYLVTSILRSSSS